MTEKPEERRSIISMLKELKAQLDLEKGHKDAGQLLKECVKNIVLQKGVIVKQIEDKNKDGNIDESCLQMFSAIADLIVVMGVVSNLKYDVEFSEKKRRAQTQE